MLADKPPRSLKELILFLGDHPNVQVQNIKGKRPASFKGFEDGCFTFDFPDANFCIRPRNHHEIGIIFGDKGFVLEIDKKTVSYKYSI